MATSQGWFILGFILLSIYILSFSRQIYFVCVVCLVRLRGHSFILACALGVYVLYIKTGKDLGGVGKLGFYKKFCGWEMGIMYFVLLFT